MEGGALHDYSSKVDRHHLRDWSLITGGGGGARKRGGGHVKFYPYEKGAGQNSF